MDTHIGIRGAAALIKNLGSCNGETPAYAKFPRALINIMIPAKTSTDPSKMGNWSRAKDSPGFDRSHKASSRQTNVQHHPGDL